MATELFENNDGGAQNDAQGCYGANWLGSAFTASSSHNVTSTKVRIYRVGSPGNLTLSIRASTGTIPTGSDLATSDAVDGNGLGTSLPGAMTAFTFSTPYTLTGSTEYWLILRATSGNISNRVDWVKNTNTGTGETATSSDSGASWTAFETKVSLYENYGDHIPVDYPVTMAQGSFSLSGGNRLFGVAKIVALTFGSFALTGISATFNIVQGWIKASKNTSTMTNTTKNSSSWSNDSKNTSSMANVSKNSSTWSNSSKNSSSFTNDIKN